MPKKIFTQELEGTRQRGRPRKGWREEVERDLQVPGMRRWWRELLIGKNGEVLFDRPKPTAGCSANGRRKSSRKKINFYWVLTIHFVSSHNCTLTPPGRHRLDTQPNVRSTLVLGKTRCVCTVRTGDISSRSAAQFHLLSCYHHHSTTNGTS